MIDWLVLIVYADQFINDKSSIAVKLHIAHIFFKQTGK